MTRKGLILPRQYAEKMGLPKDAMEFQMLNGIRRDLQEQLVKEGYRVRVYVPYGTEWYPYFMRRIAERPADIWFLLPAVEFQVRIYDWNIFSIHQLSSSETMGRW